VQVYVSRPGAQPRKLEAFGKTRELRPREQETLRLKLDDRAFARWIDGAWKVIPGEWRVCCCRNAAEEVWGENITL
jgi:hypothetical protein